MSARDLDTIRFTAAEAAATLGPMASLLLAFAEGPPRSLARHLLEDESQTIELGRPLELFGAPIEDGKMSRKHATLRFEDGRWVLSDLASTNGSKVNGDPMTGPRPLVPGDLVRLGNTLFFFSVAQPPPTSDAALVGESPLFTEVRKRVGWVARDTHSVLLTGETGTGKEVVARAIHERSGRSGPFVPVNCGSFVEKNLLASEIFGHVRGAFTGASSDRPGLFREAEGGTLFLDEIGEMALEHQPILLRVLETGQVRPLGDKRDVWVNVRVIAATNRPLVDTTRDGGFRSDLYARLAQYPISLPPLRERREDIPLLIQALLPRVKGAGRSLTADLVETLCLHPWSLNVRSLLNVLGIAVLSAAAARGSLSASVLGRSPDVLAALAADATIGMPKSSSTSQPELAVARNAPRGTAPRPSLAALREVLERRGGNVVGAAKELHGTRQQLYRWLAYHNLKLVEFRPAPTAKP